MLKVLKEANINNKIVLLRLDLNVPFNKNKIVSDFRIRKAESDNIGKQTSQIRIFGLA